MRISVLLISNFENNEQTFQQDVFLVWWFISTRILFYVSNFTFLLRNTESGEWKIEPINILDNLFFNIFIICNQHTLRKVVNWSQIIRTEKKKYRQYDNKIEGVWLSNKFCISTQNGLCIEKTVGQIRENSGQRRVWFSVFFQIILCEFVISFFFSSSVWCHMGQKELMPLKIISKFHVHFFGRSFSFFFLKEFVFFFFSW